MIPIDPQTALTVLALGERAVAALLKSGDVTEDEIEAARKVGEMSDLAYDEYMAELRRRRAGQ